MAGRKDIVGKALKVAADYFAPNTDEYAANLSKFYGSTDPALRKRFYTGTSKDKDFTAFQESRHGTWLTDDPEDASSYALNNDSQNLRLVPGTWNYEAVNSASRVIPSYARIENPYRGDKPDWVMKQDNYKKAQSDWFDQLRSQGYDAWVPDSSNGSLAVVLKNQGTNVKSAIGNQGTFDTTKKHMGKSEGGRTGYQTKGRVVGSVVGDAVDAAMRLVSGAEPQKTVKAYKLFKQEGGKLYPLFVGANEEVPMNQWVKATAGPQAASGKVKSKIGELTYRPGWHAGDLPIATHIGAKSHGDPSLPPDTRPSNQVWGEVEMASDVDWQKVANERARMTKKGTPDPKTAHITDQVPYGGYYRYKTNPNMTGEWMIGGDMRVNRVLTDDEVKAINEAAGVADLPRREGYGPGGVIDDIVKMAGRIVSGADEPAKTGIRAYQGSPHNFAAERLVRFPDKTEQYIVGTPDVLPDVPEGAEVIQDFPLGRMRMDKIGTGEGAQAYGHGLYTAENEGIARSYRDALAGGVKPEFRPTDKYSTVGWKAEAEKLFPNDRERQAAFHLFNQMKNKDYVLENHDFITSLPHNQGKPYEWEGVEFTRDRLAQLADEFYDPGKIYEVNIAADPNTFLDWDKPLSEQPEAVQKAVSNISNLRGESGGYIWDSLVKQKNAEGAFGEHMADLRPAIKTGPKAAQEYLREAGIPGIKYFDAGSRGAGDGTRNYVVFDDKLISIIRKYGIAGASAMLGYNLMEQLDPKQALAASMADQDYQSSRPQRSMGGNNSVSGALNVARGLQGGM